MCKRRRPLIALGGTLLPVSFGPTALRGFPITGSGGRVEYRLARNAVVREFRKGRLSRVEVCDAHPELLRAVRDTGEITPEIEKELGDFLDSYARTFA